MRIFDDVNRRIHLSKINEKKIFDEETEYYTKNNMTDVNLFGNPVKNLYKNMNLQVVTNYNCNHDCLFCIEGTENISEKKLPDEVFGNLVDNIVQEYQVKNTVKPVVTVTGGEPLLFKNRLKIILETLKKNKVQRYGVNTNGKFLNQPYYIDLFNQYFNTEPFHVNVSRHHFDDVKNNKLFNGKAISTTELVEANNKLGNKLTLQAILAKDFIGNLASIKEYMNYFIDKGFNSFSFRGLCELDSTKDYFRNKVKFSKDHNVDFFQIAEEVAGNSDFQFKQQKIGDHYVYELYKYKGKTFRLTYSNFDYLRQQETKEINQGMNICRNAIVFPNGKFATGWADDIKQLKIPTSLQAYVETKAKNMISTTKNLKFKA